MLLLVIVNSIILTICVLEDKLIPFLVHQSSVKMNLSQIKKIKIDAKQTKQTDDNYLSRFDELIKNQPDHLNLSIFEMYISVWIGMYFRFDPICFDCLEYPARSPITKEPSFSLSPNWRGLGFEFFLPIIIINIFSKDSIKRSRRLIEERRITRTRRTN